MASLPLPVLHTAWQPTPQGAVRQGPPPPLELPERGPRKPKCAARLAALWNSPVGPDQTLACCLRPHPPQCPFGQKGRLLLGRQRAQTAEILKASYFSSKHISPHLEALELPWNIPDLTLPLPCSFLLESIRSQPAGETKYFSSGWGFAHSLIPRLPRAPGKPAPGPGCPTPGWPGLGRADTSQLRTQMPAPL